MVVMEATFDESKLDGFAFASRKLPEFMHFRMVRCPVCDLLYVTPSPALEWLQQGYREAEFDAGLESRYAARTHSRMLPAIIKRLPDLNGALDIGAGDGAFVTQLLRHGFCGIIGIEPSRTPLAQAHESIRPFLREGFFSGDEVESGSLSLVTCFQTLEHTEQPGQLAHQAFALLKPGGAFLCVAHNYRSLSARLLGTKSPIYDIEHLQLHSRRSLREMYERAGFIDVVVKPLRNDYPLSYWLKLLPIHVGLKKMLITGLDQLGLGRILLPIWAGNLWALGYKPN